MAIKVTRKDQNEANENLIRRFNRKVLQSGIMPLKKSQMRFSKPISKRERRSKAIIREIRRAEKAERMRLGSNNYSHQSVAIIISKYPTDNVSGLLRRLPLEVRRTGVGIERRRQKLFCLLPN